VLRLSNYVEKDEEKRKELLSNALERILRVLGERLSEEGKNKILYYLNRVFLAMDLLTQYTMTLSSRILHVVVINHLSMFIISI